jgi:transposase
MPWIFGSGFKRMWGMAIPTLGGAIGTGERTRRVEAWAGDLTGCPPTSTTSGASAPSPHRRWAMRGIDRAKVMLTDTGALFLFPPPYSPDRNSIEMTFSKVNVRLGQVTARRGHAKGVRTSRWRPRLTTKSYSPSF